MAVKKTQVIEDKAVCITPAELGEVIKIVQDGINEKIVTGVIPMNRAINGVGIAGDVVCLPRNQALAYQAKGYLLIILED